MKKKYSLKKNEQIQKILKNGSFFKNYNFILYINKNNQDKNYIAFLAGKKLGKAPVRNYIKRKMRICCAQYWDNLKKGYDIVLIGRESIYDEKQEKLIKSLENLFKKHKILDIDKNKECHLKNEK